MSFAWPLALLSLLVAPALLVAYWWILRRRRKQAVRYSSVALLRSLLPRRKRWQRHLPVALLLLSLVALARGRRSPARGAQRPLLADVGHPRHGRLRVDVLDRRPAQPAGRRAGGGPRVRREPAEGRSHGPRRLLGLRGAGRSPDDRSQGARRRDRVPHRRAWHRHRRGDAEGPRRDRRGEPEVAPVGDAPETGSAPATDAARRQRLRARHRRAPDRRREQPGARAARRRARTRSSGGFACTRSASGRRFPRRPSCTRDQLGADAFDSGGFGGRRRRRVRRPRRIRGRGFRRGADVPTLQAVARQTGGTYHGAEDADQLRKVFADLPRDIATQKKRTEITWIFAALGALLAAAAIAASMRWSPYP